MDTHNAILVEHRSNELAKSADVHLKMPHSSPRHFAAKPIFIGAGQPLQPPSTQRCHLGACQLTSLIAFHSRKSIDQHSASPQVSRPQAVASLEQETTAVSSNVQPLSKGLRSAPRLPKSRSSGRKPRLRVAVDVDEGEGVSHSVLNNQYVISQAAGELLYVAVLHSLC